MKATLALAAIAAGALALAAPAHDVFPVINQRTQVPSYPSPCSHETETPVPTLPLPPSLTDPSLTPGIVTAPFSVGMPPHSPSTKTSKVTTTRAKAHPPPSLTPAVACAKFSANSPPPCSTTEATKPARVVFQPLPCSLVDLDLTPPVVTASFSVGPRPSFATNPRQGQANYATNEKRAVGASSASRQNKMSTVGLSLTLLAAAHVL